MMNFVQRKNLKRNIRILNIHLTVVKILTVNKKNDLSFINSKSREIKYLKKDVSLVYTVLFINI